jgi:hypothetical protein
MSAHTFPTKCLSPLKFFAARDFGPCPRCPRRVFFFGFLIWIQIASSGTRVFRIIASQNHTDRPYFGLWRIVNGTGEE